MDGGTVYYETDADNMYVVLIQDNAQKKPTVIIKNALKEEGYHATRCSVKINNKRFSLFWIYGMLDEKIIRDKHGTLHLYDDAVPLYLELLKKAKYYTWKKNGYFYCLLAYIIKKPLLLLLTTTTIIFTIIGILFNIALLISALLFIALLTTIWFSADRLTQLAPWWRKIYEGAFPDLSKLKKKLKTGITAESVYECWMLAKLAGIKIPEPIDKNTINELLKNVGIEVKNEKVSFIKKELAANCPKCEEKMIVRVPLIDILLSPKEIVKVAAKHSDHTVIFEIDKNFNIRRSDVLTFAE